MVGIYRKLHPAVSDTTGSMEGGITPGKEAPVFDCDFGKLGIQICFDIYFDYGGRELARKGADGHSRSYPGGDSRLRFPNKPPSSGRLPHSTWGVPSSSRRRFNRQWFGLPADS